ncbi:fimbrial protein [Citrobacter freundii]|uniref:fimbrial protein n=1 Tax=Citrobacter freundii TaxID=546 RepID=UPI00177E4AD5|nr:fimbrial protein [Citrobacter freundii]MBD9990443.1 fimbrial protein [Citrobacter freundii]MBE0052586.1 fimbrial protein [Citrobacter freundii]MDT7291834.1 fimbrial protein [Citrobacter freundii]HBU6166531.1 fimbrial protein [Citrobacter freundii]HBV8018234.1 fimbrial protein [Citrobacter freundii]
MNKAILATALVSMLSAGSAMAGVQGGQINFHGLVSDTTCSKVVSTARGNETTDGNVYLQTAAPADITDGIQAASYGAKAEPFTIVLNCEGAADVTSTTKAKLTMDSSFSNSKGTLNNDENLVVSGVNAAGNVNIAIHDDTSGTPTQMKVDGSDVHEATFDANKVATYNFTASYVKADATKDVTSGHVTTNAMYTFTYN